MNRSLLFLMFGSPIPAPKPSSRAAAGAVEKPSFIACAMSGIPGPSSSTSTSICPGPMVTRISPREAWMTTFVSASYAAMIVRRMAAGSTPMRLSTAFRSLEAAPALA